MSTTKEDTKGEETDLDDVFYSVLSNKRRRYALHYLKQLAEPVSVQELAEQVAAWENRKEIVELTSQERKRVYISLYQSHLPTMDEEGLVNYDEDRGTVEVTDPVRNRELYLEIVPDEDIPWSAYYVGLTVANLFLLVLAWAGIPPFSAIPDFGVGLLILASFGLSTFAQIYYDRQMRIGDEGPPPELRSSRDEG